MKLRPPDWIVREHDHVWRKEGANNIQRFLYGVSATWFLYKTASDQPAESDIVTNVQVPDEIRKQILSTMNDLDLPLTEKDIDIYVTRRYHVQSHGCDLYDSKIHFGVPLRYLFEQEPEIVAESLRGFKVDIEQYLARVYSDRNAWIAKQYQKHGPSEPLFLSREGQISDQEFLGTFMDSFFPSQDQMSFTFAREMLHIKEYRYVKEWLAVAMLPAVVVHFCGLAVKSTIWKIPTTLLVISLPIYLAWSAVPIAGAYEIQADYEVSQLKEEWKRGAADEFAKGMVIEEHFTAWQPWFYPPYTQRDAKFREAMEKNDKMEATGFNLSFMVKQ